MLLFIKYLVNFVFKHVRTFCIFSNYPIFLYILSVFFMYKLCGISIEGKLLNVRIASHKQIMNNNEIINIRKIMGLKANVDYSDDKNYHKLRYGHLMIMTDQDHDGSHIKGLVINFIDHFWPSLLKRKGFLNEFITPIVVCKKGKDVTFFLRTIFEHFRALL